MPTRPAIASIFALAGSCLALACSAPKEATKDPAPLAATSAPIVAAESAPRTSYGAKIGSAEKVALDDLLKDPARYADKTVLTEGVITAVCQGAGCWLEIGDERTKAHVKLGGHKFFVPRTSSGKHAEVEARVLPVVDDGHCEAEAEEQTGKVAKVELLATGVELFLEMRFTAVFAALLLVACGSPKADVAPDAKAPTARGQTIRFDYESLDDRPVSTEGLHGRATLLVFLTTYGDPSIIEARFAKKVLREHVPRINAAAIFLERIDNRPLARVFRDALDLPYPLAMADEASIAGKGPFLGLDTVPTVVVLDGEGREVFRKVGITYPDELVRALRSAQQ